MMSNKNTVYTVKEFEDGGIVVLEDLDALKNYIEGEVDTLMAGQEKDFTIGAQHFTDQELKDLPEYDG